MITVYTAKKIITMNESWPEASVIAVRDGRILEVGTMESIQTWLREDDHVVDNQFAGSVLMPGLIDPHLHPMMAAVLLPMQFITALPWHFPWESVPATTSHEAYLDALRAGHRDTEAGKPFFTWGYHRHWHGDIDRTLLDEIFGDRPAVMWQRSFHEVYLNTAMMELVGIDEERVNGRPQINYEAGHFYENGLGYAIQKLNSIIMSPDWIATGLERVKQVAHYGGHTTVGDMAVGIFDFDMEWQAALNIIDTEDCPYRVTCIAHGPILRVKQGGIEESLAKAQSLPELNTERLKFGNKIKLFTDGAFFSQLAMMLEPGYVDGHDGEWLLAPEDYEAIARAYWHAGFEIHVHCTGDMGLELALDTLEKLQWEKPRFNHNYTIEHFGFSTPEQVRRIKKLGANVSANVYYLHELSAAYARRGIGYERAAQTARIGQCEREDILLGLHSDFPMAPAMPLHNAWVACQRENSDGEIMAPNERLSLNKALRAITIDAAEILGIAGETGSLRAGKKADMVVLDKDPFDVGGEGLKSINVLATVFEGRIFPIDN